MLRTTDRLPVSRINAVVVATLVAGAVVTLALGEVLQGLGLLAVAVGGTWCSVVARRPAAGDVTRLNALEWRDERDRRLGADALAVVGAAALVWSIVALVVASVVTSGAVVWLAYGQAMVLNAVWGLANSVVVRRG